MSQTTVSLITDTVVAVVLGFVAVSDAQAPWLLKNEIPGWLFWGFFFLVILGDITQIGRPDSKEASPIELFKFDIGM